MKTKLISAIMATLLLVGLTGCTTDESAKQETAPAITESTMAEQIDDISSAPEVKEIEVEEIEEVEEIDAVDATESTKENPVPYGEWGSITVSDGGWPKPAYVRISNVSTDQTEVQVLIDEYNSNNSNEITPLEEHAEFLDYVLVEYEVYFPTNYTEYDNISFSSLTFVRENNQEDWIASDGSYYWMGGVTVVDDVSIDERAKNGDTVTCKIVYPMIKDNTDYSLYHKSRSVDLDSYYDTYWAIK